MRTLSVLLIASLLIAPGIAAQSTIMHDGCDDGMSTDEHAECHEDQDSPGFGIIATIGLLGAVVFAARRRD